MDTPKTSLHRSRPLAVIALAAVAILAAGAVVYRAWDRPRPPAPAGGEQAPPAAVAAAADEPDAALAPHDARALLEGASPHELYRRALAAGDLVRRVAVVADNLAEGVSPRRELEAIAPRAAFSVRDRGGSIAIDPRSYARYDAFADAVASVDAAHLARAYRALRPALTAAYRALGYPEASLDAVVARGLRRLEAAPVRDGDVLVVARGGVYAFGDAALEALPAVEKHLLRMGPRNTRAIQAKAAEVAEALALPRLSRR